MDEIIKIIFYTIVIISLSFIHSDLNKIEKTIREKEKEKIETVTNIQTEYVIIGDGVKWDVKIPKGDKKGVKK